MQPLNATHLLQSMIQHKASDLYLTVGVPPALRVYDAIIYLEHPPLSAEDVEGLIPQFISENQRDEYEGTLELNTAVNLLAPSRFRLNLMRQQGMPAIVIRYIQNTIPTLESLNLPPIYGEMILKRRGLVLVSGPTGSGKSTSLAAMVGHRNTHGSGHIITVEDPIEYVHEHQGCIISQRDVGLDTYSYPIALKNALRQRPDVVVIGEVRDREVMEQAIYFAETGHLCVATIHANNANQTIERVLNFFPEDRHPQVLINLALNLRAVFSQRILSATDGTRTLALEIMVNSGAIKQLIEENKIRQIREFIEKNALEGMQTFDQHLYELVKAGTITQEAAIAESDNPSNLRLRFANDHSTERASAAGLNALKPIKAPLSPNSNF